MKLTVGSLFAGIGGFDLGLERTGGFETKWFCDNDAYCQQVLAKHWPGVPCHPDVCTIGADNVEPVDVLCGGFPCQDISLAGKGAGLAGERSGLWSEYARLVRELRPRYVIVENVPALRKRGLEVVLADLMACGYDAEWDGIPASAVGAHHRRDRIWLVAYPQRDPLRLEPGRGSGSGGQGAALVGCDGEAQPLAHATSERQHGGADLQGARGNPAQRCEAVDHAGHSRPSRGAVADPKRTGLQRRPGRGESCEGGARSEPASVGEGLRGQWLPEPDVGRVAHGVPARVDRLRSLGNALVPQIAEWIGERILDYENGG